MRARPPWPQMVAATALVVVAPAIVVSILHATGVVTSFWAGLALAAALSLLATAAGTNFWRRRASGDVLFSDLLIWGWLRRRRLERRLGRADDLLAEAAAADPERKAAVLAEIGAALDANDPYIDGHSRRVTRYAMMIAGRLDVSDAQRRRVQATAAVHDIGKLHLPADVLHKPGRLTDEEFAIVKGHTTEGAAMLSSLGDPQLAAAVRSHHERWDGSGYPDGLAGEQIPLEARIISVADTFDAITWKRSYRAAQHHQRALAVIDEEAGKQLDPGAARAFISCYTDRRGIAAWAVVAWTAVAPHARRVASAAGGAVAAPLVTVAVAAAATGVGSTGHRRDGETAAQAAPAAVATQSPTPQATPTASPSATPHAAARTPTASPLPAAAGTPVAGTPTAQPSSSRPKASPADVPPAPPALPPANDPSSIFEDPLTPPWPVTPEPPSGGPVPEPSPTPPEPTPTTAPTPTPPEPTPTTSPTPPEPTPTATPHPPHTAEDCKDGGWVDLGYPNQGECIADAVQP